eukprot:gene5076-5575_t
MAKRQLPSDDSEDSDDSDPTSKEPKTDEDVSEEEFRDFCRKWFPEKTIRMVVKDLKCDTLIPVGTGGIIGQRAKAEIGKREHVKIDQVGAPWRVNTYTVKDQMIVKKHVKIRAAELFVERKVEKLRAIGWKTTYESYFTREVLFCLDNNAVRLNNNPTTREFVFPLVEVKTDRPKQTVPELKDQIQNDIVDMLKACYGFTSDLEVDFDLYNVYEFSTDPMYSKGILHEILFILSNVLKYRGKTIDEIFEDADLPPITDSDLYRKFTDKEKYDKKWPKRFTTFEVKGGGTRSGSTPIYYGKHLKNKREEVEVYKKNLLG